MRCMGAVTKHPYLKSWGWEQAEIHPFTKLNMYYNKLSGDNTLHVQLFLGRCWQWLSFVLVSSAGWKQRKHRGHLHPLHWFPFKTSPWIVLVLTNPPIPSPRPLPLSTLYRMMRTPSWSGVVCVRSRSTRVNFVAALFFSQVDWLAGAHESALSCTACGCGKE